MQTKQSFCLICDAAHTNHTPALSVRPCPFDECILGKGTKKHYIPHHFEQTELCLCSGVTRDNSAWGAGGGGRNWHLF